MVFETRSFTLDSSLKPIHILLHWHSLLSLEEELGSWAWPGCSRLPYGTNPERGQDYQRSKLFRLNLFCWDCLSTRSSDLDLLSLYIWLELKLWSQVSFWDLALQVQLQLHPTSHRSLSWRRRSVRRSLHHQKASNQKRVSPLNALFIQVTKYWGLKLAMHMFVLGLPCFMAQCSNLFGDPLKIDSPLNAWIIQVTNIGVWNLQCTCFFWGCHASWHNAQNLFGDPLKIDPSDKYRGLKLAMPMFGIAMLHGTMLDSFWRPSSGCAPCSPSEAWSVAFGCQGWWPRVWQCWQGWCGLGGGR